MSTPVLIGILVTACGLCALVGVVAWAFERARKDIW